MAAKAKTQAPDIDTDWLVTWPNGEPLLEDDASGPKFHKSETAAIKYAKAKFASEQAEQLCIYRLSHTIERPTVEPVLLVAG